MYKRKTYDVWELYIDYGYGDGWEYVLTEKSASGARKRRNESAEHSPQYSTSIVKRRVPIEEIA